MRKIFSVSFVAITLLPLAMPVSVNADEVGFQNDALTMPITESFPNSGSIVFDENGRVLDVSNEILLEKSNSTDNPLSRRQTHFPWGFWTISTDGFPFVAWGNVRLNSTIHHRTRRYRVSAVLLNSNGTVIKANHVTGNAGQTRTARVTGSNNLRHAPSYYIF
ncbi:MULTISPECIES: hypothetical protein [Enterococcus]|uniref:hypothetical protein n=1 Tax=Enterococcus TaxID=1350 RepID=UPI0020913C8E|nr:hypothetical protein [Enterococcus faecium]MCO5434369.1 hypothetical protein [Enterococcus faecium]MCO5451858.1 hypothetical protein [Enterococcus faecium]